MLRITVSFCAVTLVCIEAGFAVYADDQPKPDPHQASVVAIDRESEIVAALDKKMTCELRETTLRDFAVSIGEKIGRPCLLDRRALDEVGMPDDAPLTGKYREMSIRSLLSHVLGELDLTWIPHGGLLVITTREEAESQRLTKVVDVTDLVRTPSSSREEEFDHDSLIRLITSTIYPSSWDAVGGPGSVNVFCGGLVVSRKHQRNASSPIRMLPLAFNATACCSLCHTAKAPGRSVASLAAGGIGWFMGTFSR